MVIFSILSLIILTTLSPSIEAGERSPRAALEFGGAYRYADYGRRDRSFRYDQRRRLGNRGYRYSRYSRGRPLQYHHHRYGYRYPRQRFQIHPQRNYRFRRDFFAPGIYYDTYPGAGYYFPTSHYSNRVIYTPQRWDDSTVVRVQYTDDDEVIVELANGMRFRVDAEGGDWEGSQVRILYPGLHFLGDRAVQLFDDHRLLINDDEYHIEPIN